MGAPSAWLAIRFKLPCSTFEHLVSHVTSGSVHTDIVLHKAGSDSHKFSYGAFVNQPFNMYYLPQEEKYSDLYRNLMLEISEEEYDRCTKYLGIWVKRETPYNYSDTFVGIPAMGGTGQNGNIVMPDVDGSRPETLRTVYCSQAATLLIRHCLDPEGPHRELIEKLHDLNSRLVSPHTLYMIMMDHAHMASNEALFGDILHDSNKAASAQESDGQWDIDY